MVLLYAFFKQNRSGFLFFYIHFVAEVVTFYVLGQVLGGVGTKIYGVGDFLVVDGVAFLVLLYDFYAFVPQILVGYVIDEGIRLPALLLGLLCFLASLTLMTLGLSPVLVVLVLALGSILMHEAGAERTLREAKGKMTMSSLYVSGGAFGVITGKILSIQGCPVYVICGICLTILLPMYVLKKTEGYEEGLEAYQFSGNRFSMRTGILCATLVVAVRSYSSMGIPTSWNQTLLQTVFLYISMGLGKALGGIAIDYLGIRKTIYISTLGALPFLIMGDRYMGISLIGILLFSMTMAVTLAVLVSMMPRKPGIAFGYTTIGLFVGLCPVFMMPLPGRTLNSLIIVVLTIVSAVLLQMLTAKTH